MIKINRLECPNPSALNNKNYKHPDNKKALKKSNHDKCMYCESKISHIDYGDVEHIKPKSKYPELEFEWNNLGYACPKCNRQFKNDTYDEEIPYLNPYDEEPREYIISSGAILFPLQGNERGEITINGLGLNRPELLERRYNRIQEIDKAIKACFRASNETIRNKALDELKKEANNDKEYSLAIKSLLKQHNIDV
jgi:DNA-directed RNA polymerase subunit RPC12/RpoP